MVVKWCVCGVVVCVLGASSQNPLFGLEVKLEHRKEQRDYSVLISGNVVMISYL